MDSQIILQRLARMMLSRHEKGLPPYTLLLPSSLSLTPALLHTLCGEAKWNRLPNELRSLGPADRLLYLQPLLDYKQHALGYSALTSLVRHGYIQTIITTNIDSELEDALAEEDFYLNRDYILLIPGRDQDDYIVQTLDAYHHGVRIIKLHGSLRDQVLPETYPVFFQLRPGIHERISSLLNRDLIVAGSIEYDYDLVRAFSSQQRNTLYYTLPSTPANNDSIVRLLEARHVPPQNFLITGEAGAFDIFFPALAQLVLSSTSTMSDTTSNARNHTHAKESTMSAQQQNEQPQADVLLVTVTEVETRAVLQAMLGSQRSRLSRFEQGNYTYYNLGIINNARVYLVQSAMGASGPGGSILTIREGLRTLQPTSIIMVGIAFGCNERKQQIGDILVSERVISYEQQRMGIRADGSPDIQLRGDRATASTRLLNKCKSALLDWYGQQVSFGLLLSGEKLIDNIAFREQLQTIEPEAIGGEMEASGLYTVAHDFHTDWLCIKAICDYANGKKSDNKQANQALAAENAAAFTLHMLQQTDLTIR